jgi:peptide/nickel transport system substrate-binding protein
MLLVSACNSGSDDTADDNTQQVDTGTDVELVDEGEPQTGGSISMAVTAETNGWNPATAQWADAGNFVGGTFLEPMMTYNAEGEVVPWLAESATPTDTGDDGHRSWVIKLREGIKFHDGTEMTAEQAANSINLAVTEGLAAVALGQYFEGFEVLDKYTFQINLSVRWATFSGVLAGPSGYVMSAGMLAAPENGADDPVGTGPYQFRSWVIDDRLVVDAFDGYWGGPCALPEPLESDRELCAEMGVPMGQRNGPFLDSIEFQPIVDGQQRANALRSGDVNLMLTTRATDVAALQNDYQVIRDYNGEKTFAMTNVRKAPFDNIHARKALAYATQRDDIRNLISGGEEIPADSWPYSPDSRWGGPTTPEEAGYLEYNPEKAREEVAAYTADTGQPLSFRFVGLPATEDVQIMQALQEQWRQFGIEAEITTLEQTAYILLLTQADFDLAYFRNYAYPDPDSLYVFWAEHTATQDIKINFGGYYSPTTEDALGWGRTTTGFEGRKEAYDRLMRERNEQVVDVWMFNTPYALIGDENIRGLNWARAAGFGNFLPKPFFGGIWIDQTAS